MKLKYKVGDLIKDNHMTMRVMAIRSEDSFYTYLIKVIKIFSFDARYDEGHEGYVRQNWLEHSEAKIVKEISWRQW